MIWVKTHAGDRFKGGKLHAGYPIPFHPNKNAFWTACNNSYAAPASEERDGNMEFCKRCAKRVGAEVVKWN